LTKLNKSQAKSPQGNWLTRALFFEETDADKSSVVYTLKDEDHEGFPSLYILYMDMGDIFEYEFANTYLYSWSHWEALTQCSWFKPIVQRWRKELELKIRSQAFRSVQADAAKESRTSNSSNKYLLERGWLDKPTKGRPTKDQIKQAAKERADETKALENDLIRISGTGYLPKTTSTAQ
jgi:hypothetical protein